MRDKSFAAKEDGSSIQVFAMEVKKWIGARGTAGTLQRSTQPDESRYF